MPLALVMDFETGRNLGDSLTVLCGGRAGFGNVREMRVGIQSKGDALTERYNHAGYVVSVALRVVSVPIRSKCPSPSLFSCAYV